MEPALVFQKVGMALGLGLLVGLQRESVQSRLAGIRTFALITVLGAVAALISSDGWLVAVGALGVAGLLVAGHILEVRDKHADPGLTTEVAALLMYGVGAYLVVGHTAVALAVGGTVAILLHFKEPMHEFVSKIGPTDLKAIMQFVLIALVIWPVLPDKSYDPYGVLNPHQIWLMVVLIVGISLGGYVGYKLFGERAGSVLAGVLGGMISSTATTVSYGRRARDASENAPVVGLVIVIASAVAFARVLAEIAVVAPGVFWAMAPPLAVMFVGMVLLCLGLYSLTRSQALEISEQKNPAELPVALMFAGLYAVVVLTVAAAQDALGEGALYPVAALSGLHDLDAITLSTARLVDQSQLQVDTGWRLILTASLSNLVFKAAIVAFVGARRVLVWIAIPFLIALAGGTLLLFSWPGTS